MQEPWQFEDPACRDLDTEIFFPDIYPKGQYTPYAMRMIRELCNSCVHKQACIAWAVKHEAHGVWGGTTEYDRRRIRKELNIPFDSLEKYSA